MAFVPGAVLIAFGLVRVGLLGVARRQGAGRQGAAGRRLTVGGVLDGATWILLGDVLLAAAAAVWHVALILAIAALAASMAGRVSAWPVHWSQLGDPAAWRESR